MTVTTEATTPEEARAILDQHTMLRDVLVLTLVDYCIVAIVLYVLEIPLAVVAAVVVAALIGAAVFMSYLARRAARLTRTFRDPFTGELRSDVPPPGEHVAQRRRALGAASLTTIAALVVVVALL